MTFAELATRWTIRVAILLYFVGSVTEANAQSSSRRSSRARLAWTLGCLLYLAHVVCAFHFYHHWSHAEAYRHTAERTAQTIGWFWGGGLFFNYAFTIAWVANVACWWCDPPSRGERAAWLTIVLRAFMLFMVVNATIIFEAGAVRWFGLAGTAAVSASWLASRYAPDR